MAVPKYSEREWEEFFNSKDFDVTAFTDNGKNNKAKKTISGNAGDGKSESDAEWKAKERLIDRLFNS